MAALLCILHGSAVNFFAMKYYRQALFLEAEV